MMDPDSFDVLGKWEIDRGPQTARLRFLVAPRLRHDDFERVGNAEHGAERRESGDSAGRRLRPPAACLGSASGAVISRRSILATSSRWRWSCVRRTIPTKAYGFLGVVVSLKDLSASIWLWHRDNGKWAIEKIIEIPAEPADPALLPPLLKGFKAVPPLVTDINLSLDDRFLYVSCWGTGEFRQYDVSDPFKPEADRLGAHRRHRPQGAASRPTRRSR